MFDARDPSLTSHSSFPASDGRDIARGVPWTYSVQREYGIWTAQLSHCDAAELVNTLLTQGLPMVSIPQMTIPGFPLPPAQWVEQRDYSVPSVDLLLEPEVLLKDGGARLGLIQLDEHHATVLTTDLQTLYAVWCAWIQQRYPDHSVEIDPHRAEWAKQVSLLWPHPEGQWSQIEPVGSKNITAFDIIDFGWDPEGELFSRHRTRILKTSDKSWRTGWMW